MAEKLTLRDIHKAQRPRKLDGLTREQLASDREQMSVGYMARHYGVSRATMYRKLREVGLIHEQGQSA